MEFSSVLRRNPRSVALKATDFLCPTRRARVQDPSLSLQRVRQTSPRTEHFRHAHGTQRQARASRRQRKSGTIERRQHDPFIVLVRDQIPPAASQASPSIEVTAHAQIVNCPWHRHRHFIAGPNPIHLSRRNVESYPLLPCPSAAPPPARSATPRPNPLVDALNSKRLRRQSLRPSTVARTDQRSLRFLRQFPRPSRACFFRG